MTTARGLLDWLLRKDGRRSASTLVERGKARVSPVQPPEVEPLMRFENRGEIGRGGMGAVHRIFEKTLLRHIAMKLLPPDLAQHHGLQQRFIEEAQINAQLDHPNIVPIHELGVDEHGTLFFTMKLVDGMTLEAKVIAEGARVRRLDWIDPYLEIFLKVCDAVAFAHSRGVVHRDLKPANIMVGAYGEVYVMDWGVAGLVEGRTEVEVSRDRAHDELDVDGMVIGTVEYMPPEQALGNTGEIDERSDIFALGGLLYFILTGRPPYALGDRAAKLEQAQACRVIAPERQPLAMLLPRGLGKVAMRALSKEPAERYPSVLELKNDVIAQLRGGLELPRRTFASGALVTVEGQPGDTAYIIEQGRCQAFKMIDGKKKVLRQMGPGDVFGETAILAHKPRTAYVEAVGELVVMEVTARILEEGVGMNSWLAPFVQALAERFREADERLAQLERTR